MERFLSFPKIVGDGLSEEIFVNVSKIVCVRDSGIDSCTIFIEGAGEVIVQGTFRQTCLEIDEDAELDATDKTDEGNNINDDKE
jgi:hypothetical protein